MSKIGKRPIQIPGNVIVKATDDLVSCEGPLGVIKVNRLPFIEVVLKDGFVELKPLKETKQANTNWGTLHSLIQNAVTGVTSGFKKNLMIEGVGFRASIEGSSLILYIGYSHPVKFEPPAGVALGVSKNIISITGIDKAEVGQTAARIRALKKPEPYKGKGIRYEKEIIRRKAGKKTAGTAK